MRETLEQGLFDENRQPSGGDFEFFRDFFNEEQAASFAQVLDAHGIPYKLEKNRTLLEGTITGYGLVPHSVVKLRTADFARVNHILGEDALKDEGFIANHYFQNYKATELLEVVQKPDEWTSEDVAVARFLLDKQGVAIPEAQVEAYKAQRAETLKAGRTVNTGLVAVYLLVILVGAFLLSIFFLVGGIGLGLYYWQDYLIDGEGNKFFTFEPGTRQLGKAIFIISVALLVGWASLPFWAPSFF